MTTDKAQAYNSFWNSFGLPAYDQRSVPSGTAFPYITYEYSDAGFSEEITASASLWYRTTSWADITKKAQDIFDYISMGGKIIHYTDGALWIKRGIPFSQRMDDPDDTLIRRIVLNIDMESLS